MHKVDRARLELCELPHGAQFALRHTSGFDSMAKGNFGERLKREREMREVTLNEVTVATRIGPRFLDALENEQWEKLPGGVFNRGFVRSVARYLGLDEESLLAEYDLARGQQEDAPTHVRHENRIPSTPKWAVLLFVLGVLLIGAGLVAGGIYGWHRYVAHRARAIQKSSTISPAPSATLFADGRLAIEQFRDPFGL